RAKDAVGEHTEVINEKKRQKRKTPQANLSARPPRETGICCLGQPEANGAAIAPGSHARSLRGCRIVRAKTCEGRCRSSRLAGTRLRPHAGPRLFESHRPAEPSQERR